jgi:hypothetical protein
LFLKKNLAIAVSTPKARKTDSAPQLQAKTYPNKQQGNAVKNGAQYKRKKPALAIKKNKRLLS